MIIAYIVGGFANQLYKYSCAYSLAKKYNQEIVIMAIDRMRFAEPYLLDELNIPLHKKLIINSYEAERELQEIYLNKRVITITDDNFSLVNDVLFREYDIVILNGVFQREKYFISYIQDLRNIFTLKIHSTALEIFDQLIENKISVAIHWRRGDFLYRKEINNEDFNLEKFYKAAIVYFEDRYKNVDFYVFSDDISYVKEMLGYKKNINYVKLTGGKYAVFEEFLCMVKCNHRVCTPGSSYGNFANKLCEKESKTAIYPGNQQNTSNYIYLNDNDILELSSRYHKEDINITKYNESRQIEQIDMKSNRIEEIERKSFNIFYQSSISENNMLLLKAIDLYNNGEYERAEQCFVELWQFMFDNKDFHYYYFLTLYKQGKIYESIIEAVMYSKISLEADLISYFDDDFLSIYNFILNIEKFNIIINPYLCFKNATYTDIINIGLLLRRLGHNISFIFREGDDNDCSAENISYLLNRLGNAEFSLDQENNERQMNIKVCNYLLKNRYMFTDLRGYNYNCKIYDYNKINLQYDINEFIYELCINAKFKNVILSKSDKINMSNYNLENTLLATWDFTNPYDPETYFYKRRKDLDIDQLYKNNNIIITENGNTYSKLISKYSNKKIYMFKSKFKECSYKIYNEKTSISKLNSINEDIFYKVLFLLKTIEEY